MKDKTLRLLAMLFAVTLIAAACGSDDAETASDEDSTPTTEATVEEDPVATTEAMVEEEPAETTAAPEPEPEPEPSGPANALAEPVTIATTCAPAAAQLAFQVAQDEGIFAAHNITIECVQIGNGPETAAALIGGDAQYANNVHINTIPLVSGGADVVAFHQTMDANLFDIIVDVDYAGLAPAGSSWEEVIQSLAGTRVGVVARNAAAEDIVRLLFNEAGVDPEGLTYVGVGLDSVTPMIGDEIDWSITFDPNIITAVANGVAVRPFQLQSDEGPANSNWPGQMQIASREWVEANTDIVCAIKASYNEASTWLADPANRDRTIEIAGGLLAQIEDQELLTALVDQYSDKFNPTGEQDSAMLDVIGQAAFDAGKADRVYGSADYVLSPDCA